MSSPGCGLSAVGFPKTLSLAPAAKAGAEVPANTSPKMHAMISSGKSLNAFFFIFTPDRFLLTFHIWSPRRKYLSPAHPAVKTCFKPNRFAPPFLELPVKDYISCLGVDGYWMIDRGARLPEGCPPTCGLAKAVHPYSPEGRLTFKTSCADTRSPSVVRMKYHPKLPGYPFTGAEPKAGSMASLTGRNIHLAYRLWKLQKKGMDPLFSGPTSFCFSKRKIHWRDQPPAETNP